ncbi:DUF7269 family protein [Haloarcula litorea]|uniref:DUF7269 family protein n=1 Tax=Haloarcula litorea TaxID=3032579 RepID=UPI0023E87401|nr:hypothetical protein [Halomicroarcula sp. GDY20]
MSRTETVARADEGTAVGDADAAVDAGDDAATDERTRVARATLDGRPEPADGGLGWRLAATVGLLALAGSVAVALVPGLVAVPGDQSAAAMLRGALPVVAAAVALLGLSAALGTDGHAAADARVTFPDEPEAVDGEDRELVGGELDERLAAIGGRVDRYDPLEAGYAGDVRDRLRETAERTLAESAGYDADGAAEAVEHGTWTDDPRAAAFLGGGSVPDPPLRVQLRDWASGEAFDRRVAATLAEIRRHRDGDAR